MKGYRYPLPCVSDRIPIAYNSSNKQLYLCGYQQLKIIHVDNIIKENPQFDVYESDRLRGSELIFINNTVHIIGGDKNVRDDDGKLRTTDKPICNYNSHYTVQTTNKSTDAIG